MLRTKLVEDWPMLSISRRLEIHINTFAYDELKRLSMEKVKNFYLLTMVNCYELFLLG